MEFFDDKEFEEIGFSYILQKLEVLTPYGEEEKHCIHFFSSAESEKLMYELENLELMKVNFEKNPFLFSELEAVMMKIKNIRGSIARCRNSMTLDEVELFEIKNFSMLSQNFKNIFEKTKVKLKKIKLNSLEDVIDLLDPESRGIPTFSIYESYSEKLKAIRREKDELEKSIIKNIGTDDEEKLRKQRLEVVAQEEAEERSIREKLSRKISAELDKLEENMSSIGKIDFILAKVKLAEEYISVKPLFISESIYFKELLNPKLKDSFMKKNKKFTSITIELSKGTTILTGANMGGKTVALKTIVLNLYLAHCGFFVFGKEARMPFLDYIYFIFQDMQSDKSGLSSFGGEIIKLKQIITDAEGKIGFAALDEFSKGTNPSEGTNLVKAVAEYFNDKRSMTIVATHYDGIANEAMQHYEVVGLKNVKLEELRKNIYKSSADAVDMIQQHMDYTLEKVEGTNRTPREALNICKLLGLQKDILDRVQDNYDEL